MGIHFIIDSASDVLPREAEALGVTHVPLKVVFSGEVYNDGVDLSHREFFEKLTASRELPTTCQIPPADFTAACEPLVSAGEDVIIITLSSKLSGTCQSAMIAAAEYPGRVWVVDSLSAAIGERILLQLGLELAGQGLSAAQVAAALDEEKHQICLVAMIDTLEYLKKGGRISAATALAGSVLAIKPAITLRDGEVVMAGKARGTRQGNALLRQIIGENGGVNTEKPFALVYSGLDDALLRQFLENSPELLGSWEKELPAYSLGCAIGTHIGPGAYGAAFFRK